MCRRDAWLSCVSFDGRSGSRLEVGSLPRPSPRRPASADAPPWPPPAPCALSSNRSRSAQYAFSVRVGSDAFISASAFSTSSIAARTFSIIVDSATSRARRLARQRRSGCRPTTSASCSRKPAMHARLRGHHDRFGFSTTASIDSIAQR